ncbi:MAG: hypothetical protein MUQ26_02460 [Armatimonadetes bacterium]|nr:hypothetical protein [Armatimonadota bacterium]
MSNVVAAVAVLAAVLSPAGAAVSQGIELEYRRPLGQVVEYRLFIDASGEQTALEERRPVRLSAELALTEEVIAQGKDGALWLRVGARAVDVKDPSGTFATGKRGDWPDIRVRMTPRGEVLDVSLATGEDRPGMAERSFVSLMVQPAPVVLPLHPVAVGDEWEWESGEARQQSRLVEVSGEGANRVARIASESQSPLELTEASDALGLTTRMSGDVTQRSDVELLLAHGLVARHKGHMDIRTNSEVTLELPEGQRTFEMQSTLKIDFDLRLARIDGQPVERR